MAARAAVARRGSLPREPLRGRRAIGLLPRAEAKNGGPKTCRGRAPGLSWGDAAEGKEEEAKVVKGAKG